MSLEAGLRNYFVAADVDNSGTVSMQSVVNSLTSESLGIGISEDDAKGYALMVRGPVPFSDTSDLILALLAARERYKI
jgi:hypothetical protein